VLRGQCLGEKLHPKGVLGPLLISGRESKFLNNIFIFEKGLLTDHLAVGGF